MNAAVRGNAVPMHQHRFHSARIALLALFALSSPIALAQEAIPVTDALVKAKCGTCHSTDERGIMERISWERTTPEGWQEALKKMVLEKHVALTPPEARSIVRYLSASHGLAPEEAKPVMYYPERRIHDEVGVKGDYPLATCAKCHPAARALSWRMSADDWKQFAERHAAQYKFAKNDAAFAYLIAGAPLHTTPWDAWNARPHELKLTGRWLVTAHIPGRGEYVGEMRVDAGAAPDEFTTLLTLHSIRDGSTVARAGHALVFGDYAWRGRSHGVNAANASPDDPANEAREVLWISPDQTKAEGRWFWGQYQEFGVDVELRRPASGAALLALDRASLKTGSQAASIQLIGDNFPTDVTPADLNFGPGVSVRRIVSHTSGEIAAELDIAANAVSGKRDVSLRGAALEGGLAIYDRVDYVKVTPESSMAAFGNEKYPKGFEQFEAIGYQRGPDGKAHTADDLELGPVPVTWSMEVFYAVDTRGNDKVGAVSSNGLFTPAPQNPGSDYDIWVVATAANEKDKDGAPLVGKGYVVVTIPEYTFNGRHYVRDLERWIEDGAW